MQNEEAIVVHLLYEVDVDPADDERLSAPSVTSERSQRGLRSLSRSVSLSSATTWSFPSPPFADDGVVLEEDANADIEEDANADTANIDSCAAFGLAEFDLSLDS